LEGKNEGSGGQGRLKSKKHVFLSKIMDENIWKTGVAQVA